MPPSRINDKATLLSLIATILIYVSVPLYLVGYGAPYWMEKTVYPGIRAGLWHVCREEAKQNKSGGNNATRWVCYDSKEYLINDWGESWIPGVRGLSTLALLFLLASVTASVTIFWNKIRNDMATGFITMATVITDSFFGLSVIIIQSVKIFADGFENYKLSWSFVVCCLAMCLSLAAAGLLFANVYLLNQQNIEQNTRQRYSRGNRMPAIQPAGQITGTVTNYRNT